MTELESMKELVTKWHESKKWAQCFICEKLNITNPRDILLPENRGRRQFPETEWFYRTHGLGVDIFKDNNKGGIDFDFDSEGINSFKLRIFMIKQLNDGKLTKRHYKKLLNDTEIWSSAFNLMNNKVKIR